MKKIALVIALGIVSIIFIFMTKLQFSNLSSFSSLLGWSMWGYLYICYVFAVTHIVKTKNQKPTLICGISLVFQFIIFGMISYIIPCGYWGNKTILTFLLVCLVVLETITIILMICKENKTGKNVAFDNLAQNRNIVVNNAVFLSLIIYAGFSNVFSGISHSLNILIIWMQMATFYLCFFVFFSCKIYKKYNIGRKRYMLDLLGVFIAFTSINYNAYWGKDILYSTILFQLYFLTPYIITFINMYEMELQRNC